MNSQFKSIGWWTICSVLLLCGIMAKGQNNDCIDNPTYSGWSCSQQGTTNTLGTLSYTNASRCVGSTVSQPYFTTSPTFNNGQKTQTVHHTCPYPYDEIQYQTVTYYASSLYFTKTNASWPNLSGPFTNAGTYYYTALYNGIASGGVCANIAGIVAGTIKITVTNSLPVIVTQPTNQTVAIGSNATFTVVATGCPSVSGYQWWFNITNQIVSATNFSLTLTNVQLTNAGTYTVVVSDPSGSVTSSNALLTVNSGPSVTGPADVTTCPGSPVTFSATATGCPPFSYAWTFVSATNVFGFNSSYTQFMGTNSSVTIPNAYPDRSGTYTVVVTGSCGSRTNSAVLTVLTNLTVAGPISKSVCLGSTTTLTVAASGAGPITYQWRYGTNIMAGNTNSTLSISNVGATNVGSYSVVVNGYCRSVTNTATLQILSITNQPANTTINYGQNATFYVGVAGATSATYQWYKNNVAIPGATASSYTAVQPPVADSGANYKVTVSIPDCTQTSTNATLTVVRVPLLVQAEDKAKVYGDNNPALTWVATGFINGDSLSSLTGAPALSTSVNTGSSSGIYPIGISAGTLANNNYSLSFSNGLFMVAKAALTLTAADKSREYGLTNPILTWSASGFVNGETTNTLIGSPQIITPASTNSFAGTYTILIGQGTLLSSNYLYDFTSGSLTITKAAISVVATNSVTRNTGATNPPFAGTITGIRNNDNITATYGSPATIWSSTGSYPIIPSLIDPDGKLVNYNVSISNGVLTVSDCAPYSLSQSSSSHAVNLGASISLRVYAAGATPMTFLWKQNGTNITQPNVTGKTTDWLTITNFKSVNLGSYTCVLSNGCGVSTAPATVLNLGETLGGFTNVCGLYPIALPQSILTNSPNGTQVTIGADGPVASGACLWLTWNGNGNTPTLQDSLTIPGDSSTKYVNSHNSEDRTISIDDWLEISTGVSTAINNKLDALINYCTNHTIQLPVWYNNPRNGGNNGELQFYNYANVKLVGYDLGGGTKSITVKYYGDYQCEPASAVFSIMDAAYTERSQPIVIDKAASVSDFNIGALTVQFITNGLSEDILSFTNQGTGVNQISISGTNISYTFTAGDTRQVGTFTSGSGISPLVVQFNNNSTIDAVRATMRAMTYFNTNTYSPSRLTRTLQAVLSHNGVINIEPAKFNIIIVPINDPPAVQITSPADGAAFVGGEVISIAASAYDVDSLSISVQFKTNGTAAGFASVGNSGVYTYDWGSAPLGTNTVAAVATDIEGLSVTSAVVNVVVADKPPTIYIVTPQNNASHAAPATIRLTSVAQDDGMVTNVVYFTNGVRIASSQNSPYSVTIPNLHGSTNVFYAYAYDNVGHSNISQLVTNIVLKQSPVVAILQPHSNDTNVAGQNIQLIAKATDVDGTITGVQFVVSNVVLGTASVISNNLYYLTWTNAWQISTTNLYAIATDNDGLKATNSVLMTIQSACSMATISSLILSASEVVGGSALTGKVILNAPANSGGQTVTISNNSSFVSVPQFVYIPEGQWSNTFAISTYGVSATNAISLTARYHGQSAVSADLKLLPTTGSGGTVSGSGSAIRSGFDTNQLAANDDGYVGYPVDIGFSLTYYAIAYSNLWVNNNGLVTFNYGLGTYTPDYPIGEIPGNPAIAPFWADVDTRGEGSGLTSYGTNTVDGHRAFGVTWGNVGYYGAHMDKTNSFQVVLIERADIGAGNFDIEFNYEKIQWETGDASAGVGGFGGFPVRFGYGNGLGDGFELPGSSISGALVDDGSNALIKTNYNSLINGRYLFQQRSVVGASVGQIVFVRDDGVRQNGSFSAVAPSKGASYDTLSQFNIASIVGKVVGAQIFRGGNLLTSTGSRYDLELGVAGISGGISSFGPLFVDAHLLANTNYTASWILGTNFCPDIQAQLGNTYYLKLTNRTSSVCGSAYAIQDTPQSMWPWNKNVLTVAVEAERKIPAGRCRDFVPDGVNAPANGTWEIRFRSQVIASSGRPNGWNVEDDYTYLKGFNITVPTNAAPDNGYEARVILPGWFSGRSAVFSVLPSGSDNSAPTLLPINVSSDIIKLPDVLTLTVSLDALAPVGDAYIPIYTNGMPAFELVIPAGQLSVSTNLLLSNTAGAGTLEYFASYNGYRKAKVQTVTNACTPPDPVANLTAKSRPSTILVHWDAVPNATGYNVSRSTDGINYDSVFHRLLTTNYVDTEIVSTVTYYYAVTALSNLCESTPAYTSVQAQYNASMPAPWIAPFGGVYNDQITVLLTNYIPNTTIYYTTNGDTPDDNSASFLNSGVITLTSNATVKAYSRNQNYYYPSRIVAANFTIFKPVQIDCGANTTALLTATNPYSNIGGSGFYSTRFVFTNRNEDVGRLVTITALSTNFDTVLFLTDGSTNVFDANDDYNDTNTDSQVVYRVNSAGKVVVEVTSYDPWKTGNFTLRMDCALLAGLNVFTNAFTNNTYAFTTNTSRLPNYSWMDFGVITVGNTATNYITITNNGRGNLVVSNMAVYPALTNNNGFTVFPTNLITLTNGQMTNLVVTFQSSQLANYSGYLVFGDNDGEGETPFYVGLTGKARAAAAPPYVEIYYPTSGLNVPATNSTITNVTLEVSAIAMDGDGIHHVEFWNGGVLLQSVTNAPYTIIWTNPPAGSRTIIARAYDNPLSSQYSETNVTIMVGTPTLTLSTNTCVGLSNGTFTVTATLLNATNGPVAGSNVVFHVSGAHNLLYTNVTAANGQTNFTYTGTSSGLDWIWASATVNDIPIASDPVRRIWALPVQCGNSYSGTLTNSDGFSFACGCSVPSHYTDFYSITGTSNTVLTLTMTSTNFSTFMYLMNTNCMAIPVTVEQLNQNDTQVRYTFPSNGVYIIEATSADIFQTGNYRLLFSCDIPQAAPKFAALVSGTNVPTYTMFDLGSTTNGMALTQVFTITNQGTTNLNITGYGFTLPSVFTITPSPVTTIAPSSAVAFTVQFLASTAGRYTGSLVITNNDAIRNPFVINLTAVSNPNGTPPTVTLTAPLSESKFVSPSTITLTANATASGNGVTITNVEFGYRTAQGSYFIGRDLTPSGSPYSTDWAITTPGKYALLAAAWDSEGRMSVSAPVNVEVYPSTQNRAPVATNDYPFVLANSADNVIDVLANDGDPDGDTLIITNVTPPRYGTASIVSGGKLVRYTPPPQIQGSDGFSYDISDGHGGSSRGRVWITIEAGAMPQPAIVYPEPESTLSVGTTTNIHLTIEPPEVLPNITKVEFYYGEELVGVVTNAPFTNFVWQVRSVQCDCGFKARVYDKFGQLNDSLPVHYNFVNTSGEHPFAAIDNPAAPYASDNAPVVNTTTVQDGILVVTGSVYSVVGTTTNNAQYKVVIKNMDGGVVRDSGWLPAAKIINGVINTNDLTTLRNDVYDLELLVRNNYETTTETVRFALDSNLKIGVFTFSEQDLAIPVGGMPLSVVRTYDSLNLNAGDFGYSWTWAINDLDVKLHDIREDFDDFLEGGSFSMRVGGNRDVTLTLPDGRRVTYRYNLKLIKIAGIGNEYIADWEASWKAPTGVTAKLTTLHPENGDNVMHEWVTEDATLRFFGKSDTSFPAESYDFPGFNLTMNDGTVYELTREDLGDHETLLDYKETSAHTYGSPRLARIIQPGGDIIVINPSTPGLDGRNHFSVDHFDSTGHKTRSVYFNRDEQNRIAAIMDPISGSNGLPVVKYEYDQSTNLARVLKLQNRSGSGSYTTNTYLYENGKFPHYLTKILDARGVPVTRNLYDDSGKLIGMIDAAGKTNLFLHDITGRLETTYDRMGNKTTYAYDTRGNVTTTIDALGHTKRMTYDDPNNPSAETSHTDALGHTTYFAYDGSGNRTQVVDALGHTNLMSYDGNGNLLSQTDPLGNVTETHYDAAGNPIEENQIDIQGQTIEQTFSHYENGKLVEVINGNNQSLIHYSYDELGNVTNVSFAQGVGRRFTYDANGNQTSSSSTGKKLDGSPAITTTTNIYDAVGRVTMAIDAYGNTNATFYNAIGKVDYSVSFYSSTNSITNSIIYNARGNVIQTVSPFGVNSTVYDDNARPILTADRNGISGTLTEYDAVGRVMRTLRATNVVVNIVSDPNNPGQLMSVIGSAGVPYSTNSMEYFDNGCLKSSTGPDGQKTTYQYTANGQNQSVTDPLNHTTYSFYDDAGHQTLTWDALNHATHFVYDTLGRRTATVFDDGSSVTNEYNPVGKKVGYIDQAGRRTQFGYNISGALTNVIKPTVLNPANNQPAAPQWNYQYDDQGRLLVTTDANGHSTTNAFDEFGRQAKHWLAMGQVCSNQFDAQGRLTNQVDYKNQHTYIRYDKFGRVAAKYLYAANAVNPSNSVTYAYNQLGQLTNITERYGMDATNGLAYSGSGRSGIATKFMATVGRNPNASGGAAGLILLAFGLAAIPREKRRQLAELALEIWDEQVDAFHALAGSHVLARLGRRLRRSPRLRMPSCGWRFVTLITLAALIANEPGMDSLWTARADYSYPNNDSTATTRITNFIYDFDGHLVQVNCPEGVINYGYDLATGRHIETNTQKSNIQYGYDELGRLKTVTVTKRNGSTANETTTYGYDAVGNRSSMTLPNGVTTTYAYDSLNRMTNLTHKAGAALKASYSYKLDVTGRRTNAVEVLSLEGTTSYQTNTLNWAYDGMYQLTNEVSVTTSTNATYAYTNAFVYDLNGNRVTRVRTGGGAETVNYVYDANDQLTSENNGSSTTYLYDGNGSLTNKTASGATVSYVYDVANKLRSVTTPSTSVSYLYNEQGIRVSQTVGGTTTKYLIDANNHTGYAQVLEETNSASGIVRSYVIGDDLLAQADAAANPNYYLYDGHGSTRQLSTSVGAVYQHYGYDAYGNLQSSTSTASPDTTMLYSGEQYDSTLGMYNLRARYYNPSNGRFNQRDAFDGINSDPQTLHKYLYANCDPVNGMDPSGNLTMTEILVVTAITFVVTALYLHNVRGLSIKASIALAAVTAALTFFFLITAPLMAAAVAEAIAVPTIGGAIGLSCMGTLVLYGLWSMSKEASFIIFNVLMSSSYTKEQKLIAAAQLLNMVLIMLVSVRAVTDPAPNPSGGGGAPPTPTTPMKSYFRVISEGEWQDIDATHTFSFEQGQSSPLPGPTPGTTLPGKFFWESLPEAQKFAADNGNQWWPGGWRIIEVKVPANTPVTTFGSAIDKIDNIGRAIFIELKNLADAIVSEAPKSPN